MTEEITYASFLRRMTAAICDIFIISCIVFIFSPLIAVLLEGLHGYLIYHILYLILQLFLSAIITLFFWIKYDATPGKMLVKIKICSFKESSKPKINQYIIRLFGYLISCLPIFLGFAMIHYHKKHRALHDILAGTAVVRTDLKKLGG